VYKVVSLPEFTLYPHQGSEMVWRLSKQRHAANGAIMRTSILGTYEFWDVDKVAENTEKIADRYDGRIKPYIDKAWSSSAEELQLDEPDSMGYTLKAMSAGLWAYVHAENFEHGLLEVINEGGDADTNGAVAGSILGAKFGYHSIPQKYIDGLIRRDILEAKFKEYIDRLQKHFAK
jgi:ADP-ribosylglycohydrolase